MNSSESPCTTKCELDNNTEYCVKCGRSTFEIQNWLSYDSDTKKQVVKKAKLRRKEQNGLGTSN